MLLQVVSGIAVLTTGLLLMAFASNKAVEHSVKIALAFGISPFMMGLLLVSIGTDLPEIVNSLVSCAMGHGNIDVGDSIGSVLTQITLVLGLLPFLGKSFSVERDDIIVTGSCQILSLLLAFSIVEKGFISRINALIFVCSWPVYMILTGKLAARNQKSKEVEEYQRNRFYHFGIAIISFAGVAIGAYLMVRSVIILSQVFETSEYVVSFFVASIGTSLPELAVDLTALRKKQYELAIGDIIGSCIVDATLSIGIGQVFFPQKVSYEFADLTILYTIFASLAVIITLAIRERMDKRAGVLFIVLYALSYGIVYIVTM